MDSAFSVGHPVDVVTGKLWSEVEDYLVPGRMPLRLRRRYSSARTPYPGTFGPLWSCAFDMRIRRTLDGYVLIAEDGETEIHFDAEGGDLIRNPGAFHELRIEEHRLVVTRWDPEALSEGASLEDESSVLEYFDSRSEETQSIVLYVFDDIRGEEWSLIRSREYLDGRGIDFERDNAGRVLRVRQRREGRGLELERDASGLVRQVFLFAVSKEDPARIERRSVARYDYDGQGRLVGAGNVAGSIATYEYDEQNRLSREAGDGIWYRFTFDREGRCTETTGPDGFDLHRIEYDDIGRRRIVTNSLGERRILTLTSALQVETEISPLGLTTAYAYDEAGRLASITEPGGAVTSWEYGESGDLVRTTSPGGGQTLLEYNERHQVTTIVDPGGFRWTRRYDLAGRLTACANPLGAEWVAVYDERGDLRELRNALGHRRTFGWDAAGDAVYATDWSGNRTGFAYDSFGSPASVTDPLGNRTEFSSDAAGRISLVRYPDGAVRRYRWNVLGQIAEFTDERGGSTRLSYTGCGLPVQLTRPDGSSFQYQWSTVPGQLLAMVNELGETYSYEYDAEGRVVQETDFAGAVTGYSYLPSGDLAAMVNADSVRLEFTWDADGYMTGALASDGTYAAYAYDQRGFLTRAENAHGVIERAFDPAGLLVSEAHDGREIRFAYDPAGNRISRRSRGQETAFSWTPDQLIERISFGFAPQISFQYDAAQNETSRTLANGLAIRRRVDVRSRVTSQQVALRGAALRQETLRYDAFGSVLEWASRERRTLFSYSASDRVLAGGEEQLAYDAAGNVTQVARRGVTQTFTYGRGSVLRAAGEKQYEYDACGRMTRRTGPQGSTRFFWNGFGQLIGAELPGGSRWHYDYDALGRRIRKRGPSEVVQYVWDGDVILHEIHGSHVTSWEFEFGEYAPLAKLDPQSSRLYLCLNTVGGAAQELLDEDGAPVWHAEYDLFGGGSLTVNAVECPLRLQGQWLDPETGLHYNRFRYYDPELNRFIAPDPIGLAGGLNPYTYAPNTLTWIDPLGLAKKCPPKGKKRGPKPWPTGPHNRTIQKRIAAIKKKNPKWKHVGGGTKTEHVIKTPGGHKEVRRPDITFERPDGSLYHENVGRTKADGTPVPREVKALDDLQGATGTRPKFTPYD